MGTSNIQTDPVEVGIQTTVMAIREELMKYFKGTCIERFTADRNVSIQHIEVGHMNYQYERRQFENEYACMIWVGSVPILTVKHATDRIIFHTVVLDRSPQLRRMREGVEQFMEKFLMGVDKEYSDATNF